jgi:tRNA pseudouridine32 synthase/23S rRNA pseudouridine746 synthase
VRRTRLRAVDRIEQDAAGVSPQEFHCTAAGAGQRAIDLLAAQCPLPRQRLKDALNKGAVWLRQGGREQRLRRATKTLRRGDQLSLYYDAELLERAVPAATLLADEKDYSVWYKPAGMLAQGTRYGDHCALLRWSERAFTPARSCFLVHRLDREAEGLMLIAHSQRAAHALSQLWQQHRVVKRYEVAVLGRIGEPGERRRIDADLDGKTCATEFEIVAADAQRSALAVTLITGRKHQIRRHLAGIGHPVVGDYRYGSGGEALALRAVALQFQCPLHNRERSYALADRDPNGADITVR